MNRHETENDKKIILNVLCNVVQLNLKIKQLNQLNLKNLCTDPDFFF